MGGGIVLSSIKNSDTGVTYLVNLNFLSWIEWDADIQRYRIHFLDNTLNIFLTKDDFEKWVKENHLPYKPLA